MSSCREPTSLSTTSDLFRMAPKNLKTVVGSGTARFVVPQAFAIKATIAEVEISSSSLTKNTSFLAKGCSTHVTIRSTQFTTETMLRLLSLTSLKGKGTFLFTNPISAAKLAFTPGP